MAYNDWQLYWGDLHNHCDISYGHGSLTDALQNAREQLDFCSITGHAYWPDMPEATESTKDLISFHQAGFAKLAEKWSGVQRKIAEASEDGSFVAFLSYEVHSNADGDYTIVHRDPEGEIERAASIPELRQQLSRRRAKANDFIMFPHHIAYPTGHRGINWYSFAEELSPFIELFSMHGCSEGAELARPFLHAMGPDDWENTMAYGIAQGHHFGVIGSTDHHSAHPGSHGHGKMGVWARSLTRADLWEAFCERRVFAVTGDRIGLEFSVNGKPMGSRVAGSAENVLEGRIQAGGAIDYADIVRDGRLIRRYVPYEFDTSDASESTDNLETVIALDVGWGKRGSRLTWDVELSISDGEIRAVEPRFRGAESLSPRDKEEARDSHYESQWERLDDRRVAMKTVTSGNPNTRTSGTQGIALHASVPSTAQVTVRANNITERVPLSRLLRGAKAGFLSHEPSSPAWRLARAPRRSEFDWSFVHRDGAPASVGRSSYWLRVRQRNGEWAWSSPVCVEHER